jgi:RHS repeat-associated protein
LRCAPPDGGEASPVSGVPVHPPAACPQGADLAGTHTWHVSLPAILQETAASQTTYYVYGLDLIASMQGSTPTYYLTDGLGSTTELADNSGDVIGTYEYDAFGAVRTHTGASTQWSYTGEQNDPGGLEYLRARYYHPADGRFLSRDPFAGLIWNPQTLNGYAYATNNPILFVDPLGLCGWRDPWDCAVDLATFIGNEVAEKTLPYTAPVTFGLEQLVRKSSSGDVTNKEGGIRVVENCTGFCEEILGAGGFGAFTLGHTVFARGELSSELLRHELGHVRQYEVLGDLFLPIYFGPASAAAALVCAVTGDLSIKCLHEHNFLEYLAGPER